MQLLRQGLGAIAFYTCIPIPHTWALEFAGIARWSPLIGLLIGAVLGGVELSLQQLGMPDLTRSALVVSLWIGITGGLHLDGAMDTADGLAVTDPQHRLAVMADSHTGAFGVMAAIALFGLKTMALSQVSILSLVALMTVAAWGRWGQVLAIARYPYLKAEGKGAFHKTTMHLPQDMVLASLWICLWSGVQLWVFPYSWMALLIGMLAGLAIAWGVGAWFNRQLGGQTGDTYGAIVEWTEALLLCLFTLY